MQSLFQDVHWTVSNLGLVMVVVTETWLLDPLVVLMNDKLSFVNCVLNSKCNECFV